MEDSQAGGGSGPERSRSLFDPVAGMRAMADIQAEGLRAAGDLLERILGSETTAAGPRARSAAGDYSLLVEAWSELFQRFAAALAQPPGRGAVTVPVETNGVAAPVRLAMNGIESADGVASEVWLHNGTVSPVGPMTLRCGPLTAADGMALDGAHVRFEPRRVNVLPPRSSRAVVVSLGTTGPLRPGIYRGTIQADGAPGLWVPLEVTVDPC